jgi:hypothetical protein
LSSDASDECVERVRIVTRTDDHSQQKYNEEPQERPLQQKLKEQVHLLGDASDECVVQARGVTKIDDHIRH